MYVLDKLGVVIMCVYVKLRGVHVFVRRFDVYVLA